MATPTYQINDIVYLKESAAKGFLEALRISGVSAYGSNWLYSIAVRNTSITTATFGDHHRTMMTNAIMYFTESEFINLCDALQMSKDYHERMLLSINTQLSQMCGVT